MWTNPSDAPLMVVMPSKCISRLVKANYFTLIVSFALAAFVAMSAPATFIVSDRQETLAKIEAMTSLTEVKATASSLAMVGNNVTSICKVLFSVVVWTLLVFTALGILNLICLKKLGAAMDKSNIKTLP